MSARAGVPSARAIAENAAPTTRCLMSRSSTTPRIAGVLGLSVRGRRRTYCDFSRRRRLRADGGGNAHVVEEEVGLERRVPGGPEAQGHGLACLRRDVDG